LDIKIHTFIRIFLVNFGQTLSVGLLVPYGHSRTGSTGDDGLEMRSRNPYLIWFDLVW